MKIYNENKTQEITEYDLTKGILKNDKIFVRKHEEQQEVKEVSHERIIAEYSNGGKDIEVVIDTPYQPAKESWDEYEDIQIFVPFSQKELNEHRISELKQNLAQTDYLAIKYAEGQLSAEEYAGTKAQRQAWRDEINVLQ